MTPTSFWRVFFKGTEGKFVALMLIFSVMYALSWSGFFIRPIAMTTTPERIVFVRKTPFGDVNADWVVEVTSVDGKECVATGTAIYQRKEDDTVRMDTPPALQACLKGTAVVQMAITVQLLGIPLRPVRTTTISEVNNGK